MTTLALDVFSDTMLRAAITLVLIGIVLFLMNRFFGRGQGPRSEQLQKKYAVMTRETLDAIPDADLVEAVVANVMAKQDPKNPQPYYMLPMLSRGRAAVYSVWLIDCELRTNGFDVLFGGPSAPFCEPARDGFILLGAENCAKAIADAVALTENTDEMTGDHDLAVCHDRYLDAAEEEAPLDRCVAYIRDNPAEFIDGAEDAPAETADDAE
ncbi:MAG: hypothetical protein IKI63_06755 [Clostridia bacterium]|nr:hypothetical protein [Clostridia bacterium]